jgi:hypothetical protein
LIYHFYLYNNPGYQVARHRHRKRYSDTNTLVGARNPVCTFDISSGRSRGRAAGSGRGRARGRRASDRRRVLDDSPGTRTRRTSSGGRDGHGATRCPRTLRRKVRTPKRKQGPTSLIAGNGSDNRARDRSRLGRGRHCLDDLADRSTKNSGRIKYGRSREGRNGTNSVLARSPVRTRST